ncbi:hypothetical protein BAE44_0011043, partial [Dichanthelium oligosanthes]
HWTGPYRKSILLFPICRSASKECHLREQKCSIKLTPILLPINILEDFTKPLSLSFRLFKNILADELVVVVLVSLVPLVVPIPVMFLGLFTSGIQALIFCNVSRSQYR